MLTSRRSRELPHGGFPRYKKYNSRFKRFLVFENATSSLIETETVSSGQPANVLKVKNRFETN